MRKQKNGSQNSDRLVPGVERLGGAQKTADSAHREQPLKGKEQGERNARGNLSRGGRVLGGSASNETGSWRCFRATTREGWSHLPFGHHLAFRSVFWCARDVCAAPGTACFLISSPRSFGRAFPRSICSTLTASARGRPPRDGRRPRDLSWPPARTGERSHTNRMSNPYPPPRRFSKRGAISFAKAKLTKPWPNGRRLCSSIRAAAATPSMCINCA